MRSQPHLTHPRLLQSLRPLIVIAGVAIMLGLSACTYHGGPPVYTSAYYHPPYHYHYYPSTRVYFHLSTGYYHYRSDGHWRRAKTLPPHIRLDRYDRRRLWVDADKPYIRHKEHSQRYKPSPHYKPDDRRNREERSHNKRRHETYRRK